MILVNGRPCRCEKGETVMDLLRRESVYLPAECGGKVKCGKCKVICAGDFSPLSDAEKRLISHDEIKRGVRLACDCRINGEGSVSTLNKSAGQKLSYAYSDTSGRDYAIACDIGTTGLAVALCKDGVAVNTLVCENPQRAYAADAVGRIEYIGGDKDRLYRLQSVLLQAIDGAINELCAKQKIDCRTIENAVFAGNTIMQYIFCGLDPYKLGFAPYTADCLFGGLYDNPGLCISPKAKIYLAPCVSAYIGGDITAGLAVCRQDDCPPGKAKLFLDIGTNGEMALYTDGNYSFCSTAAGPALEGAHIKCGSIASSGAINGAFLQDGKIICRTVDGSKPRSLCGSGIIDVTALLIGSGKCDSSGAFPDGCESIQISGSVEFTQSDMRQVQLAKAAIAAGMLVLCESCKVAPDMLDTLTVAGSFGSNINIASAQKIGLIPFKNQSIKFEVPGNTSLKGAVRMTQDQDLRAAAEAIAGQGRYIELANSARFGELYIENMMF